MTAHTLQARMKAYLIRHGKTTTTLNKLADHFHAHRVTVSGVLSNIALDSEWSVIRHPYKSGSGEQQRITITPPDTVSKA
jgi:hypothetical protein